MGRAKIKNYLPPGQCSLIQTFPGKIWIECFENLDKITIKSGKIWMKSGKIWMNSYFLKNLDKIWNIGHRRAFRQLF